MKYNYDFILSENLPSTKIYKCDGINARIDFFEDNLFRVAIFHDGQKLRPTYSVCPLDCVMDKKGRERLSLDGFGTFQPSVNSIATSDKYNFGDYQLKVNKHNFSLTLSKNNLQLYSDRVFLAYNFGGELGSTQAHYLNRRAEEKIFGLGEKSGNVNKSGNSYVISASDSMGYDAKSTDPLYKHLPFYICSNKNGNYGIFYDTHAVSKMDFGKELNNYYGSFKSFTTQDDALVYYVMTGSVAEITTTFAKLTGRSAMPPKWTLDYCGSTMSYTDAPDADAKLRGFVGVCQQKKVRCGGFYLSSGYTTNKGRRYVFTWDKNKIPQPKELTKYFADNGINLIANIKPAFLTDHPMYEYIASRGWFLHYADGKPALVPFWAGLGSYLDFTNEGAFDFWTQMVKEQLIDYGIHSTWNDNNEYDITDQSIMACGFGQETQAYLIKPVFPMLMVMASNCAQNDGNRQMLSTRSGCAGLTRLAQTWTGDNRTSFDDLRFNHKMGMGMSLSGIFNFGHDVGGFAGVKPDKELFMRWLQYGIFLPRFTIHSWNSDGSVTEPWSYPEMMDSVINLYKLRQKLKPYLYNLMYKMRMYFAPIIAPLFYYYDGFDEESDQFMFGKDILVACIFDEGKSQLEVNLPENNGGWYKEGEHFESGRHSVKNEISDLTPYFIKGGSVIAVDVAPYLSKFEQVEFDLYPLEKGEFASDYFNDDGYSYKFENNDCVKVNFTVNCDESQILCRYANVGKQKITPKVRLIDYKTRKLTLIEDKEV